MLLLPERVTPRVLVYFFPTGALEESLEEAEDGELEESESEELLEDEPLPSPEESSSLSCFRVGRVLPVCLCFFFLFFFDFFLSFLFLCLLLRLRWDLVAAGGGGLLELGSGWPGGSRRSIGCGDAGGVRVGDQPLEWKRGRMVRREVGEVGCSERSKITRQIQGEVVVGRGTVMLRGKGRCQCSYMREVSAAVSGLMDMIRYSAREHTPRSSHESGWN